MSPRVEKLDPVKDQHKSEQKADKSSKKAKSESASLSHCMLYGLKLNRSAAGSKFSVAQGCCTVLCSNFVVCLTKVVFVCAYIYIYVYIHVCLCVFSVYMFVYAYVLNI